MKAAFEIPKNTDKNSAVAPLMLSLAEKHSFKPLESEGNQTYVGYTQQQNCGDYQNDDT